MNIAIDEKFQKKDFVIVTLIAVLFSAFTLWLIESWIKYPFFVFEMSIIILVYFILRNSTSENIFLLHRFFRVSRKSLTNYKSNNIDRFLGLLLIIFPICILVLNSINYEQKYIQLIMAFSCVSFLPGYAIVRLSGISKSLSLLEIILFSVIISFVVSGFSLLGLLPIEEHARIIFLCSIFIILGIIFVIKQRKLTSIDLSISSLSNGKDIYAILISVTLFCFVFWLLYPQATMMRDVDITRHFHNFIILSKSPDLYSGFNYLLFHAFGASLHTLSGLGQKITDIQSIQIVINLVLPLSVYTLSKRYLATIDNRIPSLSVIVYSFFSNFTFLYFLSLKVAGHPTNLDLFQLVGEKALGGSIFLQPFHYFTPMSISFIILIALFLLLRIGDQSRFRFIGMVSILTLSLNLIHVSEGLAFLIFIFVLSFATTSRLLNLERLLLGCIIGTVITDIFLITETVVMTGAFRFPQFSIISLIFFTMPLLLTFAFIYRVKISDILIQKLNRTTPKLRKRLVLIKDITLKYRFYSLLMWSLILIYIVSIVIWLSTDSIDISSVNETGYIPWFIYPIAFGVVGIMAILSLNHYSNSSKEKRSGFTIILLMILTMFLIGKVISVLNSNLIITGYYEQRLIMIAFLFASLVAPIPLIKLSDYLSFRDKGLPYVALLAFTISLLVLLGFSSLMLQVEFWNIYIHSMKISEKELEAIDYLRELLSKDKYSFVIAPTSQSRELMVFTAPAYNFPIPQIITSALYPNIPLLSFSVNGFDHGYLYLHQRDAFLLKQSPDDWLSSHLLAKLPIIYSNGVVTIFNVTKGSSPVLNSNLTLVNPTIFSDDQWLYLNEIFNKKGNLSYTEKLDQDPQMFKGKNILLSYDPDFSSHSIDNFTLDNYSNKWNVISGYWSYSGESLHGGTNTNAVENIIIRKPVTENLTELSTSFHVNSLNKNISNYVSLIYSFVDNRNYKYTGINFLEDDIYVNSYKVENGQRSGEFIWPGVKTNLKWNPGSLYELKLIIQNASHYLVINGTKYHLFNDKSLGKNGYVGLEYNGVKDLDFKDYGRKDSSMFKESKIKRYLEYLNNGGNLYIFNTYDYGTLVKLLNNTVEFNSIENDLESKDLISIFGGNGRPMNLQYNDSIENDLESKDLISIFGGNVIKSIITINNTKVVVPVFEKHIGKGKITYFDIYPTLTKYLTNSISSQDFSEVIREISSVLPLENSTKPSIDLNGLNVFQEIKGRGNIVINSTSVILLNDSYPEVILEQNHNSYKLNNITDLSITDYDTVSVLGNDEFRLGNGRGLYNNIQFEGSNDSSVSIIPENSTITGVSNGKYFEFPNISKIDLNDQQIGMYVNHPVVQINGDIFIKDFYFGKFINAKQDRMLNGTVSFTSELSDLYTLVSNFKAHGEMQKIPSSKLYTDADFLKTTFNFLSSDSISVYVLIALTSIILSIYLVKRLTQRRLR